MKQGPGLAPTQESLDPDQSLKLGLSRSELHLSPLSAVWDEVLAVDIWIFINVWLLEAIVDLC